MSSGSSNPDSHVQYDLAPGCERCGCGAVQISPLIYSPKELPKSRDYHQSHTGEVLVRQNIYETLLGIGVPATDFMQCEERRTGLPLSWWQVFPRHTLPRWNPTSTGIVLDDQCPTCHRDGHYNVPHQDPVYRYPESLFRELTSARVDFASTWECSGVSRRVATAPHHAIRYARPSTVASLRVVEILRKMVARRYLIACPLVFE